MGCKCNCHKTEYQQWLNDARDENAYLRDKIVEVENKAQELILLINILAGTKISILDDIKKYRENKEKAQKL